MTKCSDCGGTEFIEEFSFALGFIETCAICGAVEPRKKKKELLSSEDCVKATSYQLYKKSDKK